MAPVAASARPPKSIITPQIMLRIAMIVTPVGRDFGVTTAVVVSWAAAKEVGLPQLEQYFELGSIFGPH